MLRAALAAFVALAVHSAGAVGAQVCESPIDEASYREPTDRYPHGILGDDLEWGTLRLSCGARTLDVVLPEEMVFEDVAPRLVDLDADGAPEVVVVESHRDQGARLAVWGLAKKEPVRLAATPFIGTRFRWLAPVGVADLNGDGTVELAYVDRPHLAKILRVWRYSDGKLTDVTSAAGFSNHKIGERDIAGGIRHCSGGPEMLLASADWKRLLAVRLDGQTLLSRDIGRHEGRASFAAALECR
ncbi:FG-GAP repeat domain-containing protein [Aliiruegeria lutimaris]|uniref:Repeat domain-containing protein n=1 Tax=Aliiruegeria lutimaris TaxID=571298 RepID=A0A1G8V5S8_9RHOB|nr:VCBS repeat-containing protein [Aliiruegeria lutimaris]SDJ61428.1 hypothetical protein SAMN04488026_102087 [Aliiruegeria lutimaris]